MAADVNSQADLIRSAGRIQQGELNPCSARIGMTAVKVRLAESPGLRGSCNPGKFCLDLRGCPSVTVAQQTLRECPFLRKEADGYEI